MSNPKPERKEVTHREPPQRAPSVDQDTGLKIAKYKPGDVISPVKAYRMLLLKFILYGAGIGTLAGFIISLFAPNLMGEGWLMNSLSVGALIGYCAGYLRAVVLAFKEGLEESS